MSAVQTTGVPVVDNGHQVLHANVQIKMLPGQKGGSVTIDPATMTEMIGCDHSKLGSCSAALSLDKIKVTGANVPVDSHMVISTVDDVPVSEHTSLHIDHDGSVSGVHANFRKGNVHQGLDIDIPIKHTDDTTNAESRSELMTTAVGRAKNWQKHLGKTKAQILKESVVESRECTDSDGQKYNRVLVDLHSPLGTLVKLNPDSEHPIMSLYKQDLVHVQDGNLVMEQEHADNLSEELEDRFKPMSKISKGIKFTLKPMPHASNSLTSPDIAQLDVQLHRTPISHVLHTGDESEIPSAVSTSDDLSILNPSGKKQNEPESKIWEVPIGGKVPSGNVKEKLANVSTTQDDLEAPILVPNESSSFAE